VFHRLKLWARAAKRDVIALYLGLRDPRVPWPAKMLAGLVIGYALSPIDLIPDFIPVLGYLDDLILLPLGIVAVAALIPKPVLEDLRRQASQRLDTRLPHSRTAAAVVIACWAMLAVGLLALIWHCLRGSQMPACYPRFSTSADHSPRR
jgi:uncharacterized membrane protein YkvA (DUF1232 family)